MEKQTTKQGIAKVLGVPAVILLSVLTHGNATAQTSADDAMERFTIPLSKQGKPFKLNLGFDKGTINVSTYDGNDVVVNAEPEPEKFERSEPNQNQNINTNSNTNINIHEKPSSPNIVFGGKHVSGMENNNIITLRQVFPKKPLRVSIKVPRTNATLNLSIVVSGTIIVSDVTGEMELSNANGAIQLKNITGSVVANTVNGNITASFRNIDASAPMAFSTLIGNIDLTFPATAKANLKIKSDNGQIYTDFDVTEDKGHSDAKPNLQGGQGQAKYKINNKDWVYAQINAGGPEIMVSNMQGNIFIRK
jgi:hypothetical protein